MNAIKQAHQNSSLLLASHRRATERYRTTHHLPHYFVLAFMILGLCVSGCESKKSTPAPTAPQKSALINRIPATTYGVLISRAGSDQMERYRTTAWGKPSSYSIDQLKTLPGDEAATAASLLETLSKSEFASILGLGEGKSAVQEVVAFVAGESKTMSLGALATAQEGANFLPLMDTVIAKLKESGENVELLEDAPQKTVIVPLPVTEEKTLPIEKLYIAATKELCVFSTDQAYLAQAFAGPPASTQAAILQKDSFKKAYAASVADDVLTFAFLDFPDFLKNMQAFEGQVPVAEGEKSVSVAELKERLETIPLENLVYFRRMGDALADDIAINFTPRTDEQKKLLTYLAETKPADLLSTAPASFVFLLGLDAKYILQALEQFAPSDGQEATQAAAALSYAKGVESATIGLSQSKGGSPFPDLTIFLAAEKTDALYEQLKTLVMIGIKASPFKNLQWLKKQVEGLDVDYTLSPFGIGLFLAKTSNHIVLSSSEAGLVGVARSFKDGGETIWKTLPSPLQSTLGDGVGFLSYAADLTEFASLLRSVQASLSMFTGGTSPLNDEDIERLQALGTVVGTASFTGTTLNLKATYELGLP